MLFCLKQQSLLFSIFFNSAGILAQSILKNIQSVECRKGGFKKTQDKMKLNSRRTYTEKREIFEPSRRLQTLRE